MSITPFFDEKIWFGATNSWEISDEKPTAEKYRELEIELAEMLREIPQIEAHRAAIRPATVDRRPVLGFLKNEKSAVGIFNGLGTKGTLLAPFWAAKLAENLVSGVEIDLESHLNRFENRSSQF
jgi:glycine/D-amino acid oxidase-like deaminating enzyme